MKTLDLKQGTPEWHAHRATHFNASDAPAMMNCSPYETRAQLIKRLATGIKPEVDAALQKRFDDGHRFEALCRPLAEEIIGQALYPVTGSEDNGKLSASFDGLTMDESIGYEHKTLNAALRQAMVEGATGADLPLLYRIQNEQQCIVSGAATILFMASKWQNEKLVEKRHVWYETEPSLAEQIRAGWDQLEKDVAAYQPAPIEHVVTPTAKLRAELPALVVNVTGQVTESNLAEVKAVVMQRIADIPTVLETDQQFVDGDADAKWLRDVADAMRSAIARVRTGITSVNTVLTTLEQLEELADAKAVSLEKKVKSEKQARKEVIIVTARADFAAHVAGLNNELAPLRISPPQPDFDTAAKGLKTLSSIQGKVDAAMAAGKIFADGLAKDVRAKLAWHKEAAAGHEFLFSDLQQLVAKPLDDFQLAVGTRVAQHKAAEAKKKADADAETQRLIKEAADAAAAKATADATELARQQADEAAEAARADERRRVEQRDADLRSPDPAVRRAAQATMKHPNGAPMYGTSIKETGDFILLTDDGKRSVFCDLNDDPEPEAQPIRTGGGIARHAATPAPAPAVLQMPARAAAPMPASPAQLTKPTLRLGVINDRLAPCGISTTADGLRVLGFEPAEKDRSALLFHERDWPHILAAIVQRLEAITATAAA